MPLNDKNRYYLREKGWKKNFQENGPKKQAEVAILVLNKINIQPKLSKKIRKNTSYMSKEKSAKRNSQFWKIYVPNVRASIVIKETLLQFEAYIAHHTIIVGDFNTPLSNGQIIKTESKPSETQ